MRTRRWAGIVIALLAALAGGAVPAAPARTVVDPAPVDLELVLAVDASASITGSTLDFQLAGHAAAFRDPRVIAAIAGGATGRIAVTLVSWSDPASFDILVPWTVVDGQSGALAFAAAIDALPHRESAGSTGIGAALLNAAGLFRSSGARASRRVIDLVGNGTSNIGIQPEFARDRVTAEGITVNGLVILDEVAWLERYFTVNVIGGRFAFVRVAEDRASFARAILDKLAWEIAGLPVPPPPPDPP